MKYFYYPFNLIEVIANKFLPDSFNTVIPFASFIVGIIITSLLISLTLIIILRGGKQNNRGSENQ